MLTPERMTELHAAYANDREPGAFERTIRAVWDDACEACAEECRGVEWSDHWAADDACRALKHAKEPA